MGPIKRKPQCSLWQHTFKNWRQKFRDQYDPCTKMTKFFSVYLFIFIPTDKCSPQLSRKLLFATDSDNFKNPKPKNTSELWISVPEDLSTNQLLHLRLKEHGRRGGRKSLRARGSGSLLRLCLLVKLTLSIKSHQYDCLHMSWTNTTIHLPNRTGEKPMGLQPYRRNCRQLTKAESKKNSLPQGRGHQLLF